MAASDDRELLPPSPDDEGASQYGGGELSWSWSLDFEAMMAALAEPAPWSRPAKTDPASAASADSGPLGADWPEAELPDVPMDAPAIPLGVIAGRIAESLPTGPGLAGWLATSSAKELEDGALAGMAASYRRLASWAQAGELAVVAELASRSAAADDKIGVDTQGRPLRLTDEACAQVSLALTMSHTSATWWSDLGVTLAWRLTATGEALRSGQIDLTRARLIAEATVALDDEKARSVETRVLLNAGDQTTGQLRAALRRAVIAADPGGAERRRKEAEGRAQVTLYPDAEGTASLAGHNLPGVGAAAAMARITALARAMKASGAGGGIDLIRAQVFLGLLLGTLPYIPPSPDAPPDEPPDDPSADPSGDHPGTGLPADPSDAPPSTDPSDAPPSTDPLDAPPSTDPQGGRPRPDGSAPERPGHRAGAAASGAANSPARGDANAAMGACPDQAQNPRAGPRGPHPASPGPPEWPEVLSYLLPGPAAMGGLRPAGGGLLDLRVPWATLTGESGEPGQVSRLGPVTPAQARHLADLAAAAADGSVRWLVVVTGQDSQALAVARIPHRSSSCRTPPSQAQGSGLIGQVTVTVSRDTLTSRDTTTSRETLTSSLSDNYPASHDLPEAMARVWRAAQRAAEAADVLTTADAAAGGCAHGAASAGYRPSPGLREYVTARDVTCRFPTCRQPVHSCDLDHTTPFDQGGRTCRCNLGGLCRFHHQLKQHQLWHLAQAVPGFFAWTTPAGRTYTTGPDVHAA